MTIDCGTAGRQSTRGESSRFSRVCLRGQKAVHITGAIEAPMIVDGMSMLHPRLRPRPCPRRAPLAASSTREGAVVVPSRSHWTRIVAGRSHSDGRSVPFHTNRPPSRASLRLCTPRTPRLRTRPGFAPTQLTRKLALPMRCPVTIVQRGSRCRAGRDVPTGPFVVCSAREPLSARRRRPARYSATEGLGVQSGITGEVLLVAGVIGVDDLLAVSSDPTALVGGVPSHRGPVRTAHDPADAGVGGSV